MITGTNSALKGFALLLAVVVALLAMVGCIVAKQAIFIIAGVANLAIVGGSSYYLYKKWSEEIE